MKGLWIKSYLGTGRGPQTSDFCRITGLDIPTAVGSLHMLWWWIVEFVPDGNITGIHPATIAQQMHFRGDPDVLIDALFQSGFIEETETGRAIASWKEIGGQILQNRSKDAARKADSRAKAKVEKSQSNSVQKKSNGHPMDIQAKSDAEIEIEKEIKNKKDIQDITPNQEKEQNQDQNPNPQQSAEKSAAQDEQTGEDSKKGKKGSKKKTEYAEDSPFLQMAHYLKKKIDGFAETEGIAHLTKRSNMQNWANDFRLLVETDGQNDHNLIFAVMDWLPSNEFWRKNVLSGSKFREKFGKLALEMRSDEAKRKKGSGGGRGAGHTRREIPIVPKQHDQSEVPSDEEFERMMQAARDSQAAKAGETQ